jgi:hypothetical protein
LRFFSSWLRLRALSDGVAVGAERCVLELDLECPPDLEIETGLGAFLTALVLALAPPTRSGSGAGSEPLLLERALRGDGSGRPGEGSAPAGVCGE